MDAKEATSVHPNKRLQNSDDFRRHKLHSSPFLFVRYFGVMNHNCYLQGSGSNIVDFAIKLTTSGVGKVRLASLKWPFDPLDVALQLFVWNTDSGVRTEGGLGFVRPKFCKICHNFLISDRRKLKVTSKLQNTLVYICSTTVIPNLFLVTDPFSITIQLTDPHVFMINFKQIVW